MMPAPSVEDEVPHVGQQQHQPSLVRPSWPRLPSPTSEMNLRDADALPFVPPPPLLDFDSPMLLTPPLGLDVTSPTEMPSSTQRTATPPPSALSSLSHWDRDRENAEAHHSLPSVLGHLTPPLLQQQHTPAHHGHPNHHQSNHHVASSHQHQAQQPWLFSPGRHLEDDRLFSSYTDQIDRPLSYYRTDYATMRPPRHERRAHHHQAVESMGDRRSQTQQQQDLDRRCTCGQRMRLTNGAANNHDTNRQAGVATLRPIHRRQRLDSLSVLDRLLRAGALRPEDYAVLVRMEMAVTSKRPLNSTPNPAAGLDNRLRPDSMPFRDRERDREREARTLLPPPAPSHPNSTNNRSHVNSTTNASPFRPYITSDERRYTVARSSDPYLRSSVPHNLGTNAPVPQPTTALSSSSSSSSEYTYAPLKSLSSQSSTDYSPLTGHYSHHRVSLGGGGASNSHSGSQQSSQAFSAAAMGGSSNAYHSNTGAVNLCYLGAASATGASALTPCQLCGSPTCASQQGLMCGVCGGGPHHRTDVHFYNPALSSHHGQQPGSNMLGSVSGPASMGGLSIGGASTSSSSRSTPGTAGGGANKSEDNGYRMATRVTPLESSPRTVNRFKLLDAGVSGSSASAMSANSNASSSRTAAASNSNLTATTSGGGGSPGRVQDVQRSLSGPALRSNGSHSSRPARLTASQPEGRSALGRQLSRTEAIKEYLKKRTSIFFGVDEESERDLQERWLDRRKRMALRRYGQLKEEEDEPGTAAAMAHNLSGHDTLDAGSLDLPSKLSATPFAPLERESVAKLTWDGLSYVGSVISRWRKDGVGSRAAETGIPLSRNSLALPSLAAESTYHEEPSGAAINTEGSLLAKPLEEELFFDEAGGEDKVDNRSHDSRTQRGPPYQSRPGRSKRAASHVYLETRGSGVFSNAVDSGRPVEAISRRDYGMNLVRRLIQGSFRRSLGEAKNVKRQPNVFEDHRPYFTYWATTVQVLIMIVALTCYGFGSVGIGLTRKSGLVLVTSLSLQQVDYFEPSNFWIGPRPADLIHMGAKYAPCMRRDERIYADIESIRAKERNTACCIRNDNSGCVQASRQECSDLTSTWKKWTPVQAGPGGRISGSVCGQDPNFCKEPASIAPYEWPDDITKWPKCRKRVAAGAGQAAEHMVCEVIGHPCCIGIHGECRIATQEYCNFVRGHFHEEASLCSQVSCMNNVCGMIPFYNPEVPDQFYRLWTSLFLHAGLVHLAISVIVQMVLMRDLERLLGPVRLGTIYIFAGVTGNLASAIFVPYRAEVGPAGSQFGLFACLCVEVLHSWPMLKQPWWALGKLLLTLGLLFLLGLLPWVDNFAHLFGFLSGGLLSYALLPFVSFGAYDRRRKLILIGVCLLGFVIMFVGLVILLYVKPLQDPNVLSVLSYFNCIPLTRDFCPEHNIHLNKREVL